VSVNGERKKKAIRPDFNRSIRLNFQGAKLSSDTGFLLLRKIDQRFGVLEGLCSSPALGSGKNLGHDHKGKLALWQVLARVLGQGSRLSAARLVQVHAAGDVLGFSRGFDENDLYDNLRMLWEH
jgi:hypothetical protein